MKAGKASNIRLSFVEGITTTTRLAGAGTKAEVQVASFARTLRVVNLR